MSTSVAASCKRPSSGRLANRAFTRKTTGVDGLAKRMLAKQAPRVEHDPELDHPDVEVRPRSA